MEADNSLSGYASYNTKACIQGLLASTNPINLVIYKDSRENGDSYPVLFQLKRDSVNTAKVDTVYLYRWNEEQNSSDPEVITDVVNRTFKIFNTQVKGLEIWGHANSWLPSANYSARKKSSSGSQRASEWIGQDYDNYTDLWEFREALENADYDLDYLMCDACHMATAEVFYEFRDLCNYILASPLEVMGDGFQYSGIIKALSECHETEDLLPALHLAYDSYQEKYPVNGAFSLLCTDGAEDLYAQCKALYEAAGSCQQWDGNPQLYEKEIQHFGRELMSTRYYFYDLLDWAEHVAELAPDFDLQPLKDALDKCVLRSYTSETFNDGRERLEISTCCGLALSVPNFWSLETAYSTAKLESAYQNLQWRLE